MSPDEFILIRHAMPDLDPQVPPDQWHLAPTGRAAARQLEKPSNATPKSPTTKPPWW